MMPKKNFFFLFLATILSFKSVVQAREVVGHVVDIKGKPIVSASVAILKGMNH